MVQPSSSILAALVLALAACSSSSSSGSGPGTGGGGNSGGCALPPASSLTVVQATPASSATGVSVNTAVTLRFNTCLDLRTLGGITFTRYSSPVAFATSYDGATSTLTITPTAPLAWNTTYGVYMWSSLRGANGETIQATMLAATIFTTRATPDITPPTTTPSPPAGHYNTTLSVTLSCVDNVGGTGCAATRYTLDGSAPGAASPLYAAPIALSADATLRFASVDLDGNWEAPQTAIYVFDFIPPTVVAVTPGNGATGVPLDAVVTVKFDEAMNPATVGSGTLTAAPMLGNGGLPVATYDDASFTATWRPGRPLDCATTYTLTLAGAKDLAGNAIVAPVTWSFTTSSDCTPPVTTATPGGNSYTAAQSVTLGCADGTGSGCTRIVYTTDGTVPSPTNGTVALGASAGPIAVATGETVLRYYSVDLAGNREPMREERYAISTSGFTWAATASGIARGAGPVPARFYTRPALGTTYAFFRDPVSGRLWRATSRAVVFSDDGVAWTSCTPILTATKMTVPIYGVWARGGLVLAGTSDGLYGSIDGGMTWTMWLKPQIDYYTVARVGRIAGKDKDLFLATSAGLAMSHDSGRSWTWLGYPATVVRDVAYDPATAQLYVATSAGLLVSGDKGGTFTTYDTTSTPALPSSDVRGVAFTSSTIHVATSSGYVRMARDTNGLPTSAATLATPCAGGDTSILGVAASPTSVYLVTGQTFVTGSTAAFCVSTNGGTSFSPGWFKAPDQSTAIASTVYAEGTSVYVGYPPGWFLSTDGGATFTQKELQDAIADVAAAGGKIYAATGDGLAISSDGFRSFVLRKKLDGLKDSSVRRVAATGTSVYAATSWGLSISTNGGVSFGVPAFTFLNPPESVAVDGLTVYAGANTVVDRSLNAGTSWAQVLPPTSATTFLGGTPGVAVSGSRVVVGDSNQVWVSSDGGATFAAKGIAAGLAYNSASVWIQGVDLSGAATIWVASNYGAFVSTDGGATFVRPSATNLSPTTWVSGVHSKAGAPVYFDTDSGLGISTDSGATVVWMQATEGIQGVRATVYVP
jgi:Bacterial Ig-like domain/Chitobiase/beta-hexosaminidase C-terminal domain